MLLQYLLFNIFMTSSLTEDFDERCAVVPGLLTLDNLALFHTWQVGSARS